MLAAWGERLLHIVYPTYIRHALRRHPISRHQKHACIALTNAGIASRVQASKRPLFSSSQFEHQARVRYASNVTHASKRVNSGRSTGFSWITFTIATINILCWSFIIYPLVEEARKARRLQLLHSDDIEPIAELWQDAGLDRLSLEDGSSNPWPTLKDPNSIRLATIHVINEHEIQVELSEHSLQKAPKYDALSYCWTTSSGRKTIKLNGVPYDVTQSVFDALQARSRRGTTGYLWADTLCINQDDGTNVKEKNSQVQKIGQIFAGATNTWCHVGEPPPLRDDTWRSTDKHSMVAWLEFLEKPYWERLWVVQEICNANKVDITYGHFTMEWEHVLGCVTTMYETASQSGVVNSQILQNMRNIIQIDKLRRQIQQGKKVELFDLVVQTSHFKTSNARDKIFALLSLANDISGNDWELTPDYGASVCEVYRRFTMRQLIRKQDFRILSLSIYNAYSTRDLPSWIPDLSVSDRVTFSPLLAEPDDGPASISSEARPSYRLGHDLHFIECTPHKSFADGVLRPLCLTHMLNNYFIRLMLPGGVPIEGRKAVFTDENTTLDLGGALIDQIESLGDESPFGDDVPDSDIVLLLDKKPNRWQKELAEVFSRVVEERLEITRNWLERNLALARSVELDLKFGRTQTESLAAAFWLTLITNRQLEGDPARLNPDGMLYSESGNSVLGPDIISRILPCPEHIISRLITHATPFSTQQIQYIPSEDWTRYRLDGSVDKVDSAFPLQQQLERGEILARTGRHFLESAMHSSMSVFMRYVYPAMVFWFRGRRFGVTRTGRYIATPANAQKGDIIVLFLGGTVPYLLRPRGDGTYSLIGECYVHGIMHGGALYGEEYDRPFQTMRREQWTPKRMISIR